MYTYRLVLSILVLFASPQVVLCDEYINSQVLDVIDGASIMISYNGINTVCSYIGVSVPETDNQLSSISSRALQFNKELVGGKSVRLEFDSQKYDKYGRLLSYVYCGETFVNAEIIKQGYGYIAISSPNTKYAEQFLRLEKEAREGKQGLWADAVSADIPPKNSLSVETRIESLEKRIDELSKKIEQLLEIIQKLQNQSVTGKIDQKTTNQQTVARQSNQATPVTVYITNSGKKYHKQGCSFLKGQGKPISIEEAKQKGFEACKICFGDKTP
jgi:micrococcal nuclease